MIVKKFLIILFLIFFNIISSAFAEKDCNEHLDLSWSYNSNKATATFNFKSTSPKPIYIKSLDISTANNQLMIEKKYNSSKYGRSANYVLYLSAFGKNSYTFSISHLNLDLIKSGLGGYYCTYIKPEPRKTQNLTPKKDKSWFKWWYLLFIIPALGLISGFIEDSKKKINKTETKTKEKNVNRSKEHPGNLIEDIWDGKKSLGESYWLYFILINGIISFAAGFFSELNDNNFYLIPALISNIVTMVGVWNSSTNYQLSKIKKKQPYGWAYAAKVSVVLNGLSILAQGTIILSI